MGNPNCCFMIIAVTFFLSRQSPRGTVLYNLKLSNCRLCVRFTKTSETEAFSSSKPDSMVLDGGDANAIEMAPTTTLVFRINVLGLINVCAGEW